MPLPSNSLLSSIPNSRIQSMSSPLSPMKPTPLSERFTDVWSDDLYNSWLDENASWLTEQQRQYMSSNPWLRSAQADFQGNWLQRTFGDTTAASRYYADMRQNALDWASKALENFRQENYNDPVAEVQRRSAAGLNSDLDPGSISGGQTGDNDESGQPSLSMSDYQDTSAVLDGCMSFFGSIFQFGSMIQGLNQGVQNLITSDLGNNDRAFDLAVKTIAGLSDVSEEDFSKGDEEFVDLLAPAIKKANHQYSAGYNRHTRKLMTGWFDRIGKGDSMAVDAVKSELRRRIADNNTSTASLMGSPLYDKDFNTMTQKFADTLSRWEYKVNMAQLKVRNEQLASESSEYSYMRRYYQNLNPDLAAGAQNVENRQNYMQKKIANYTNEAYNDISSLIDTYGKGKWWRLPARFALPRVRVVMDNIFNSIGVGVGTVPFTKGSL